MERCRAVWRGIGRLGGLLGDRKVYWAVGTGIGR